MYSKSYYCQGSRTLWRLCFQRSFHLQLMHSQNLPAAECQGADPWSSESPRTPSCGAGALSATVTWNPSWPEKLHHPPSTRLLLLLRLPPRPSWSRPPRTGATVVPQTAASDVWVTAHDSRCSSLTAGWSSRSQSSTGHGEKSSGHWSAKKRAIGINKKDDM